MNKKGFTLIELMTVIALMGVLMLIMVPTINKSITNSKKTAYDVQIKTIKKSAYDWSLKNTDILPNDNDISLITLGTLKQFGYIDKDITNPIDKSLFPNCMFIEIKNINGKYKFNVLDDKLKDNCTESNDIYGPKLILNGNNEITVNMNDSYQDMGAKALASSGTNITDQIVTKIYKNDQKVDEIDTTKVGTYKVVYEVTSNGTTEKISRSVLVKDKTAPIIMVENHTSRFEIDILKDSDFKIPKATAYDEVDGDLTDKITISSDLNIHIKGKYEIIYEVLDSSSNKKSLKIIVNVK